MKPPTANNTMQPVSYIAPDSPKAPETTGVRNVLLESNGPSPTLNMLIPIVCLCLLLSKYQRCQ